jgi:hypothetical protein
MEWFPVLLGAVAEGNALDILEMVAGAFGIILFSYFIYSSLAHVKMFRIAINTLFE